MLSNKDWVTVAWATCVPLLILFSALAMFICYRYMRDHEQTVDSFITARDSVGVARIAWSFYAGALGSWAIALPANYASYAGLLGLSVYSLASGVPILFIALFGQLVRNKVPNASSVADYVDWRFGPLAQLYVVLLVLFNMSMAMLAEYTTMSSLFRDFIGTNDIPIILAISVFTLAYTIYGGLYVSIITDQFQGIASIVFASVIAIYVGINFDAKLPKLTTTLKGFTESGYSSILTMPVSLMAATVFSDAMWQRCWASSSPRAMGIGATLAAIGIIVVVFGFGFLGFVATWAGLVEDGTNSNLYLFQIFKNKVRPGMAKLDNVAALFAILAATTMSQAAVDSLQNGIMATVSSYLLKNQPLFMTRTFVFLLNVPLIIVGIRRYNVLNLFLVSNMLCATSTIPVVLGLVQSLETVYTGDMMFYSCIISILSVCGYGVQQKWANRTSTTQAIADGLRFAWYLNGYNWRYFLVAIASSVAAVILCIVLGLPFTLRGWRGLSPTRVVHGIKDRIAGFWHNPRKDEDDAPHATNSYSMPGSYSVPVKSIDHFPRPIVAAPPPAAVPAAHQGQFATNGGVAYGQQAGNRVRFV